MRPHLLILLAALAAPAAAADKPPAIKIGSFNWLGPDGRERHAMIAIPAKARGRQPAVLVLGRGAMQQGFAWHAAERIAAVGLIACAPDGDAPDAVGQAGATLHWLAANRYIAGKVGLIGIGASAATARQLGADRPQEVAALALVDEPAPTVPAPPSTLPTIAVASPASGDPLAARDDALDRAAVFLKEHLR